MTDDEVEIDIEISDAGRVTELHRNVTVQVLEHEDGSTSIGWIEQQNSIHEYFGEEMNDDDN